MKTPHSFSCIVIGDTALPVLCGEILLRCGHKIVGVVSDDMAVVEWARKEQLNILSHSDNLPTLLSELTFDYLFSIFNVRMLPESILQLPRRLAINFHDSLLPRYAGLFAPSWAIFEGETVHGITWHVMEKKADTGEIFHQSHIRLDPDETASTLLYKCLQAGTQSFELLTTDLAQGKMRGLPQDLEQRTLFKKYQKPSPACLVSWNWPADKIHAFVRALNFGAAANPLGTPKFQIHDDYLIIPSVEKLSCGSSYPAGTIVSVSEQLVVSTQTQDIGIREFLTLSGSSISVKQLVERYGVTIRDQLPDGLATLSESIRSFHDAIQKHEAFWVERFSSTTPLTLRGDFSSDNQRDSWETSEIILPESVLDKVRQLADQISLDVSVVLGAAHLAFLAKLEAQHRFSVGYRNPELCESLSGFENLFATTVPLVVQSQNSLTLKEWSLALKEELATINTSGSYLRDIWVRYPQLRLSRKQTRNSDFPVVLEMIETISTRGKQSYSEAFSILIAKRPLECRWVYNSSRISSSSFQKMAGEFSEFVSLATVGSFRSQLASHSDVDLCVSEDDMIDSVESTNLDGHGFSSVVNFFEAQVATTPDAVAVISENQQITYHTLNRQANRLANYLHRMGVGPEVTVAILLDRSIEMAIAIWATLKVGGVYVPLENSLPQDRLHFILRDAHIHTVITNSLSKERLPSSQPRLLYLDSELSIITRESPVFLQRDIHPGQGSYIIYTSGSTGTPKGVMIQHSSLANFVFWARRDYAILAEDKLLQFAAWIFDASAEEFFSALCCGATLVLRPTWMLSSPQTFLDHCELWNITILDLPTAFWHTLTTELLTTKASLPASIRVVIIGGEKANSTLIQQWRREIRPQVTLINTYGPTETTIVATAQNMTTLSEDKAIEPGLIGKSITNVQLYVLNSTYNPVQRGSVGELFIGGASVARGYVNKAGMTAERFFPDLFSQSSGGRMYRSGDLVCALSSGALTFKSRIDHQVKIRGFRIELGEIEYVLLKHPAIKEGVVDVRDDHRGAKFLVAYFTKNLNQSSDTEESLHLALREFIAKELPSYMVPDHFITLDYVPMTINGKIARERLPAPQKVDETRPDQQPVPETMTQRWVAQVWEEVLGVQGIGLDDHFLDLGGHSLKVFQLFSRLHSQGNYDISMGGFFSNPTVRGLAQLIDGQQKTQKDNSERFPTAVVRPTFIPLSFAQQQIWFLSQLAKGNTAYNSVFCIRFTGHLSMDILAQSLSEIVRRHESLRTTFHSRDGTPYQLIHEPFAVEVPIVDFRNLHSTKKDDALNKYILVQARTPFDLARLPLIRWTCIRLSEEEHVLVQVEHHFVHDGWSLSVLLREFHALYKSFSERRVSPLPELRLQFADFAIWQQQLLDTEALGRQVNYWKQKLCEPITHLELPYDYPRPAEKTYEGAQIRTTLSTERAEAVRQLASRERVTLYVVLLAAFYTLLHRYSGQVDIWIGTGLANRQRPETEKLIGMIINTLVLRGDLAGNPTFRVFLQRVSALTHETFLNQDVPFDKLVEVLKPERIPGKNPLFQVMFGFHDNPIPDLEFSDLLGKVEYPHNRTAKFDLNVIIIPRAEQCLGLPDSAVAKIDKTISIFWEYSTDLFSAETAKNMVAHYMNLLESIVQNPDRPISDLPILSKFEQQHLTRDWNATRTGYPSERTIPELFDEQVVERPDAIAVVAGDEQVSYGQLNSLAIQLAQYLRRQGVRLGGRVGLCLERGLDVPIGLLAVLKVGAAYVPLDPQAPAERLQGLIQDAAVDLILTHTAHRTRVSGTATPLLIVDEVAAALRHESCAAIAGSSTSAQLAYIMYTSGSTGQPKGTLISHRNVVRLVRETTYINLGEQERIGQLAPLAFDASTFEVWGPLLNGGVAVIFDQEEVVQPTVCELKLQEQGITGLFLTTALFNQLARDVPTAFETVSILLFGGEQVDPQWVRVIKHHTSTLQLAHVYGPTESTTFATWHDVRGSDLEGGTVPIGRPIANTQVYVVDRGQQLVPVGVAGELLIGGDGLAWGYLNQPGVTAEKFVPHPFSQAPGARVYRSGDQVRWRAEGMLEFLGRQDRQIKLRGYRIELEEIEAALQHHPEIREAVVVCREEPPGEKQLVAYVVPSAESVTSGELRTALQGRLPPYMVPAVFVLLPQLPLTPNGKVDLRALPQPGVEDRTSGVSYVAPRTELERQLAHIWQEVLKLERVGIHDNFFELGGHSLLATQVVSRIQDRCQVAIKLKIFFEDPTIKGLAETIEVLMWVRVRRDAEHSTYPKMQEEGTL